MAPASFRQNSAVDRVLVGVEDFLAGPWLGGCGFGVGWPYWSGFWGPGWALGWDPWWYNPYWDSPWPAYNYYPAYDYDTYGNLYPYNPDASYDRDSPARYLSTPSANFDGLHFNLTGAAGLDNGSSDRNSQTPQPEAAPNGPAPAAQPQPRLVSQPQT